MPTYAYVCQNCHHEFDAFQSITAKPLRKCPACGQAALKRLIGSGAGIIFKGSGFYCTDYRSDGYKKRRQDGHRRLRANPATRKRKPSRHQRPRWTPRQKTEDEEPKREDRGGGHVRGSIG